MKKIILTLVVIVTVSALMASTAQARNEFENGFKTELGAIAARSAVGLGIGIVTGVVRAEPYYAEPYYVPVRRTIVIERRVIPPPPPHRHPGPGYFHRPAPHCGPPHGHFPGPYTRCR